MILIPSLKNITSVCYIFYIICCVTNFSHGDSPAKQPPVEMLPTYTLNNTIPLESFYVDDTNSGESTHFKYPESSVVAYIDGARKIFQKVSFTIDRLIASGKSTDGISYLFPKDQWIHVAMHKYQSLFNQSSVVVYGSMEPWIEAAAIALNANNVVTVEYNNLTYAHPNMLTICKYQFEEFYHCNSEYLNSFDVAVSLSAFDHDGLGRYGDTLDPEGDIKAMKQVMSVLKPGGILFLSVPIGPDVVVFNLHRRYGPIRLPLLLSGWEIVERINWLEEKLTAAANWRQTYEPTFVLRKPDTLADNICVANYVVE